MDLKARFIENYDLLANKTHATQKDIVFSNKKYNSLALFSLITALTNSSMLVFGEYGTGKTSIVQGAVSIINSIPKHLVESYSIKGNTEITTEDIIGRPHMGKLNLGEEKVIWSNFVNAPAKVVDELNRIPEFKQNLLLQGMQSNQWSYLNETKKTGKTAWFATLNYKDFGNFNVIPPLLDRFDLALESKSPSINNSRLIINTEEYQDSHIPQSKETSVLFKDFIKQEYGVRLLDFSEKNKIREQIKNQLLSKNAYLLLDVILSELATCQVYGAKRSTEDCMSGCHYSGYACNKIKNPLSIRTTKALTNISKAISWLEGKNYADDLLLNQLLPYVAWHKIGLKDQFLLGFENERQNKLELHATKVLSNNIYSRFKEIHKKQTQMVSLIVEDKFSEAFNLAKEMDHPVFKEYLK